MANPQLYIRNVLAIARDGLGDGTVYCQGSSATPDQTNKRFTLAGITPIADLPAITDDIFNSYILWFPNTKGKYHVVDYAAGPGQATTFETPNLIDTGAWELRRTIHVPDILAANPALMACDGLPSQKAKIRAVNVACMIDVALPNLLGQGGFEELAAGPFPVSSQPAGKWSTGYSPIAVASASALLGSRMALWTVGGGTADLNQLLTGRLKKGKTYRCILKVQAVGAATNAGAISFQVRNFPGLTNVDANWGGAGTWSLGAIGTSPSWVTSPDFIPDFDTANGLLTMTASDVNAGSATAVRIDEIYLWEVVPVSALLAFGHNWDGIGANLYVFGNRCQRSRTGFSSGTGTDDIYIVTAASVSGIAPVRQTWTVADPPTANQAFPIYTIYIPANANFQYEIGELLLGQARTLDRSPDLGMDPNERDYREVINTTLSGAETRALFSEPRRITGRITYASAADFAVFNGDFREYHIRDGQPFALYWPGQFDELPILLKSRNVKMPYARGPRPDIEFEFIEQLG